MFKKKSFFDKLTGRIMADNDMEDDNEPQEINLTEDEPVRSASSEEGEGQLTVDVYQTPTDLIIKTMVAGVRPEDLEVSITRDMVTIKGKREEERNLSGDDYFHRELYWGIFSRTILLPQEVEIEESEAVEKHGLLIIKLPKLNKDRQTRLKVKNG